MVIFMVGKAIKKQLLETIKNQKKIAVSEPWTKHNAAGLTRK